MAKIFFKNLSHFRLLKTIDKTTKMQFLYWFETVADGISEDRPGEMLYKKGELQTSIYFIMEGEVEFVFDEQIINSEQRIDHVPYYTL